MSWCARAGLTLWRRSAAARSRVRPVAAAAADRVAVSSSANECSRSCANSRPITCETGDQGTRAVCQGSEQSTDEQPGDESQRAAGGRTTCASSSECTSRRSSGSSSTAWSSVSSRAGENSRPEGAAGGGTGGQSARSMVRELAEVTIAEGEKDWRRPGIQMESAGFQRFAN